MDTINEEIDETNVEENQAQPSQPSPPIDTSSQGKRKRGKPPLPKKAKGSSVWEHFTKEDLPLTPPESDPLVEAPPPKCQCNYCGSEFLCDTKKHGTSHLWNHFKKVCELSPWKLEDQKQKVLSFEQVKGGKEGDTSLVALAYNKEVCRTALTEYVVLDELPFRHVEGEGFKRFVKALQPRFVIPSRMTVGRDIFKLFEEEKAKLKKVLKNQRLSLTTDTWTSIQNMNYMVITAHWIDSSWAYQKRIICFSQVVDHKGETIGQEIDTCLYDWGISKLFTITVDNASSNDVAIRYLRRVFSEKQNGLILGGKFLHVRCCAHIVNLIVNEGLKEKYEAIAAIRSAVRYVRSSPSRLQTFKEYVAKQRIECKGLLCLDVQTRWNSTFLMLNCALKFRSAFQKMENDGNYSKYWNDLDRDGKPKDGPPTDNHWDDASVFVRFLETFYDITLKFSGSTYVTANKYFIEICNIYQELNELIDDDEESELLRSMAKNMKVKYDKYWGKLDQCNEALLIALVLDPRYKLEYLNCCFSDIYDVVTCSTMIKGVEQTVRAMFDEYQESVDTDNAPTVTQSHARDVSCSPSLSSMSTRSTTTTTTKNKKSRNSHEKFVARKMENEGGKTKNEVDKYLEESVELPSENFDILGWWASSGSKYKILSRMARDVLAVPVTTVASEAAFSTGGRILDPFRSSLSPTMVEALICLKNWCSSSHQPTIVRDYMDEAEEVLQTSENLESGS